MGEIVGTASAFPTDQYECRLIMHARGLGDDSPMAVYGTRDQLMRDWVIEENSTFRGLSLCRSVKAGGRRQVGNAHLPG